MPLQRFYLDEVGDPIGTKRRVAPQPFSGVPVYDMAQYHDYRSNLGAMAFTPGVIPQQTLNGSIQRLIDLPGKIVGKDANQNLGDWDPCNAGFLNAAANVARSYDIEDTFAITSITRVTTTATVTTADDHGLTTGDEVWITNATEPEYNGRFTVTVTGVDTFTYTVAGSPATPATGTPVFSKLGYVLWQFGPTRGTSAAGFLAFIEDFKQGIPFRYHDCAVKSLQIGAQAGQNLLASIVHSLGGVTLHGVPVQTVGTGSTHPVLANMWSGNFDPDATDSDIFTEFTDFATLFRSKISSAASYHATKVDPFVLGQFMRMYNQFSDKVDRIIGEVGDHIMMYLPVGATGVDGDIWQTPKRITPWTPSFPVQRPCTSINMTVRFNGYEVKVTGMQAEFSTDGVETVQQIYGRQGSEAIIAGQVACVIRPTRRIADRDLQNALILAGDTEVILDMNVGTEIGISGEFYGGEIICPRVRWNGDTYSPAEGGKDRTESLAGAAGVPDAPLSHDGRNYSDDWTINVRNDVSESVVLAT